MGRLQQEFLERVERLSDRFVDVAEELDRQGRFRRVVEQIVASGTSVGANTWEADEAMSRADFAKCLCIAIKELRESQFWLRMIARRGWITESRLAGLEEECCELRRVIGSIVSKTRSGQPSAHPA